MNYLNVEKNKTSLPVTANSFKEILVYNIDKQYNISSVCVLHDKKLAIACRDETIRVLDPFNNFHCDKEINNINHTYIFICQLDDGSITSSGGQSIMINNLIIYNAHDNNITSLIPLSLNRLASSSYNGTLKIWNAYSDTPIKVLKMELYIKTMLYVKEKNVIVSANSDGSIRVWNMSTYQCVYAITEVFEEWIHSLFKIDERRIITEIENGCNIVIDIDRGIVENIKWKIDCDFCPTEYVKLRDNKSIICGIGSKLQIYDIETHKTSNIEINNNRMIDNVLAIDDETLIVVRYNIITILKY